MMKSIGLLPRRADFTRPQFRDYYETRHAPLALGYFPFAKYVRNHLLDDEGIGFDTISEFWNEDIAKMAGLMQTEVGEIFRDDERRFMQRERITIGGSTETLLVGAPRAVEPTPQLKHVWLLRRTSDTDRPAFATAAAAWGRAVAQASGTACERALLDVVSPWPGPPFPFEALLWFWMRAGEHPAQPPVPPEVEHWRSLRVESHETPPEVMAQALRERRSRAT
jgi:EthD domain